MPAGQPRAGLPKAVRLTRAGQFAAVLNRRPAGRSAHFIMYVAPVQPEAQDAKLGLVIGKRSARRASERNLIKRLARESFRHSRQGLPACDIVLRLIRAFDLPAFPSRLAIKTACHEEFGMLFHALAAHAGQGQEA
ncbi:MAG: ribonuclease P protein component [Candidatus Protistobacter heckmanni]|nr:ribonuclease P protein component [Candidatus Protistobacter heckmanni]